ncbi:hypothetical protein EPUL_004132 [Erysiphe pulchra]|uniref:Reverse transcriptase domain-containing protein n=1 Tax=Erysiphe pulchra TaxID=225359 RepID=A0A2S4PUH0_9PEZI|nr:hypothetical protein EPUL_004132 [Erysiphe pulchra]
MYNAPVGSDQAGAGLITLLSSTDKPYFIGGDFNLRHPLWDLTATHPHASCRDIIDWYSTKELQLLNPTEVSTHSRSATLDLTFCIDKNAKCEVKADFHTTSDYETLALDDEIFYQLLEKTNDNRALETQEELRIEAADPIKNIHTALTGSYPRSKPRNFGTPWWNDEYKKASQIYRMARITGPAEFEKRELRATATCQVNSTSPGEDELTVTVLKKAWSHIGGRITRLFNGCIKLGTHPEAFKKANIIMLPKPGKRDCTLPSSYRLISLLSCLAKVLERLIARRISYWALKHRILARDQCSAVSRCSAVYLTTVLHYDIRKAWEEKRVAGIVIVDVKGAFDCVSRNRLLFRLQAQW